MSLANLIAASTVRECKDSVTHLTASFTVSSRDYFLWTTVLVIACELPLCVLLLKSYGEIFEACVDLLHLIADKIMLFD